MFFHQSYSLSSSVILHVPFFLCMWLECCKNFKKLQDDKLYFSSFVAFKCQCFQSNLPWIPIKFTFSCSMVRHRWLSVFLKCYILHSPFCICLCCKDINNYLRFVLENHQWPLLCLKWIHLQSLHPCVLYKFDPITIHFFHVQSILKIDNNQTFVSPL